MKDNSHSYAGEGRTSKPKKEQRKQIMKNENLNDLVKGISKPGKLVQVSWGDWIDLSQIIAIGLDTHDGDDEKPSIDVCFLMDGFLQAEFSDLEDAEAARDEVASLVNDFHKHSLK